jgi:proline iminopeptidase
MAANTKLGLFPEIKPYHHDFLQVDPIHNIYFEECGHPDGVPVVFLHGGPGSGCNSNQRRFFDPQHYRIILLDQRGCGRSTPQGEVKHNTTDDLVHDIEALRTHLGIRKWHVFGGSWGSTLALAYALQHTSRVMSLILRGIFLSRPSELHWFLGQVQLFYPEPWQQLCLFLPDKERHNPIEAYEKRIFSDNPALSIPAAIRWNAFESSIMTLLPKEADQAPDAPDNNTYQQIELARARVQIHYIQHHCFVGHRDLLAEAATTLSQIPTVIIQGRYDMVCPPQTAWALSKAMPHAQFVMVADAGHSAMETGICNALVTATNQFKSIT